MRAAILNGCHNNVRDYTDLLSISFPVQNTAGSSQQGGAGAGDGLDEGTSFHTGLTCGALSQ